MPENVPYAREVLNAPPSNPTPATDYFIRQPDGRIEHWISDLAAPHTLRPVSFNVAVTGAPPPTSVTRTGGAAGVTLEGVSYVEQTVRPTVNIPLTALVLENVTAGGTGPVALAVLDVAAQEWLGAGTAAVSGSGLQAPVNLTLLAGREYRVRAGNLGSGVNGTTYDGYLGSVTLGSGYAWTGLSTTGGVAYWDGTYKTVPDATQQLPLQYATGNMAGFDPSGLTIKGTAPIQVDYDADARTYTVGLGGTGGVSAVLDRGADPVIATAYAGTSWAWSLTVTEPITLTGMTFLLGLDANDAPKGGIWDEAAGTLLNADATVATPSTPTSTFAPVTLQPGTAYRLGWHGPATGNNIPTAYHQPTWAGMLMNGNNYSGTEPDVMPDSGQGQLGWPSVDLIGYHGTGAVTLAQDWITDLPRDLSALRTRLESLESTAPAVESVAGRTGVVTLSSADLTDFTEAAQDAAASLISDSTDVDAVYADGSNTLALKVTGIQNKAVPVGGTAGQALRLNASTNAWEFYDPAAGAEGGLPAPGTAGNVLTSDGSAWISQAPAGGSGGGSDPDAYSPGNLVPLRRLDPDVIARTAFTHNTTAVDAGAFVEFTPTETITLTGLRDTRQNPVTRLIPEVWRVSDQTLIATGPENNTGTATREILFTAPVTLQPGVRVLVGYRTPNNLVDMENRGGDPGYAGTTWHGTWIPGAAPNGYPATNYGAYYRPTFDLMVGVAKNKGVTGTLDPLDFPAVTAVSEIVNGGTARLKGSTPAKIFVRDSTGQLYEFVGTAVSG